MLEKLWIGLKRGALSGSKGVPCLRMVDFVLADFQFSAGWSHGDNNVGMFTRKRRCSTANDGTKPRPWARAVQSQDAMPGQPAMLFWSLLPPFIEWGLSHHLPQDLVLTQWQIHLIKNQVNDSYSSVRWTASCARAQPIYTAPLYFSLISAGVQFSIVTSMCMSGWPRALLTFLWWQETVDELTSRHITDLHHLQQSVEARDHDIASHEQRVEQLQQEVSTATEQYRECRAYKKQLEGEMESLEQLRQQAKEHQQHDAQRLKKLEQRIDELQVRMKGSGVLAGLYLIFILILSVIFTANAAVIYQTWSLVPSERPRGIVWSTTDLQTPRNCSAYTIS